MNIALTVAGWVLPIVLGPIVYAAARAVLNVTREVDDLPPIVKRGIVIVLSALAVSVLNVLGVAAPAECVTGDGFALTEACASALSAPSVVRAITAAGTAMLIHALKKSRPSA